MVELDDDGDDGYNAMQSNDNEYGDNLKREEVGVEIMLKGNYDAEDVQSDDNSQS